MTELEKRLSVTLRELSAQYERGQTHAGERIAGWSARVRTLREQVEQLQGHVNDLADDYGKLAGTKGGSRTHWTGARSAEDTAGAHGVGTAAAGAEQRPDTVRPCYSEGGARESHRLDWCSCSRS